MGALQTYREQYPQYADIDDDTLASRLYDDAYKDRFTPQEFRELLGLPDISDPMKPLRDHAQANIDAGTVHYDIDDRPATVRSGSVQTDSLNEGRPTLIPFQWEGRIVSQRIAERNAIESGVKWPSFETNEEADDASRALSESISLPDRVDAKLNTPDDILDPSPFASEQMGMAENVGRLAGTRLAHLGAMTIEGMEKITGTKGPILGALSKYLEDVDLGGVHTATTETITKAYEAGDIGGVASEVLAFGLETGGESLGDMVGVMTILPIYVVARANEMGERRAQNKGKTKADDVDMFESIPFALGSAFLERFGAKGILEPGKEIASMLGKNALMRGLANVAKQSGRGLTREGAQEFLQEGVIEYIGEKWGTKAAMDWREALVRGGWAALAGGTFGAVAGGVTGTGQALSEEYDARQIPQEFEGEAGTAPPPGIPPEPTPEPRVEPEPPVEPPIEPPTAVEPEPEPPAPSGDVINDRLLDANMRAELAYMADELVEGGGAMGALIRNEAGEVEGRVPSENPPWFQAIAKEHGYSVKQMKNSITKALAGERLGSTQQKVIQQLIETAELNESEQEVYDKAERLEDLGIDPDPLMGEDIESTLASFDEALERAYGKQGDRAGEAETPEPAEAAQAEAPETDLLGEVPRTAQEIADEARRRDETRNTGETDMTGTLFGADTAQTDIEDLPDVSSAEPGTNHVMITGHSGALSITPNQEYWLTAAQRVVKIPKQPMRREHIIKKMQNVFGLGIYQGNVKGQTRLGFYRKGHGEIRIKDHNDVEVVAHEFGHWLDDRYPWIRQLYMRHKGEMKGVSYDAEKVFEGYAEFMRLFFTDEVRAMSAAPFFYDAFVSELKNQPYAAGVLDIQEMIHAWHLQGARARLASKIGREDMPLRERVAEAMVEVPDRVLFNVLDRLRPVAQAELAMTGTLGDATRAPYHSFRLVMGQRGVMEAVYHHGTIGLDEDGDIVFTGLGLEQVWAPIDTKQMRKDYSAYSITRHAVETRREGKESLLRNDEIAAGLQLGVDNPVLAEVFEEYQAWQSRMVDFYVQAGLVSEGTRSIWDEMYENYVPFNRVMEAAGKIAKGQSYTTPFKRLHGSSRNVQDPFESIVSNTGHLVHMALINMAKRNLYRMVDSVDNQTAALYATKVPTNVRPVGISSDQVIKAVVEGYGLTWREFRSMQEMPSSPEDQDLVDTIERIRDGLGDYITFYETGIAPQGNYDFYFEDGDKRFYEINDPLLLEAIHQMGPRTHNLALSIAGGFASLLRRGVTLTPTFQVKNIIRDQMNAFTLSKGNIVPVVGGVRQILRRIYANQEYWEYMANGGGFSSTLEGHTAEELFSTKRSILRAFDRGMGAFEYATRIQEYSALRKKGYSRREATFLGRDISTDFSMRGASEAVQLLTVAKPFLNARMQGHYRIAREIGRLEPGGKYNFLGKQAFSYALRGLIGITIPSLVLLAYNWDDERYKDMPEYLKDLNWIYFYGPGEDDFVKIPKPFETGLLFGTVVERTVELWRERDGKEFTDALLWMVLEAFNMNSIPQIVAPFYELAKNEKWTGSPIVPEYMKGIEPAEQYRHYTSDAMIALGRKLNISPIQAEHLVRGYLGTLGVWALSASDEVVRTIYGRDLSAGIGGVEPDWDLYRENWLAQPFVQKGPLRRTKSQDDFYEILQAARVMVETVSHLQSADPLRLNRYLTESDKLAFMEVAGDLETVAFKARELNNQIDAIYTAPEMDAKLKREMIDKLLRARNKLFQIHQEVVDDKLLKDLSGKLKTAVQ